MKDNTIPNMEADVLEEIRAKIMFWEEVHSSIRILQIHLEESIKEVDYLKRQNKNLIDQIKQSKSILIDKNKIIADLQKQIDQENKIIGNKDIIIKVTVTQTLGPDRIKIYTNLPLPWPDSLPVEEASFVIDVLRGTGAQYVRDNFEVEPEILNTKKDKE